jgi:hypothetical protein
MNPIVIFELFHDLWCARTVKRYNLKELFLSYFASIRNGLCDYPAVREPFIRVSQRSAQNIVVVNLSNWRESL